MVSLIVNQSINYGKSINDLITDLKGRLNKENYSKKGHGYPHKFTLNQDVKLIALDVNNPIFYEKAIKIQKELEKHYGMNKQKRIRDSDNTGDTKVLKHICDHYKKTYQGSIT